VNVEFRSPQSESDYEAYFDLRWRVLREPWGHPLGSERGEDEDQAIHLMAVDGQRVIGVARLHSLNATRMQVRYMAVDPQNQGSGIGRGLLAGLEAHAVALGAKSIQLDARENAVPFYRRCGYGVEKRSYLLWGEIQHFLMVKNVSPR